MTSNMNMSPQQKEKLLSIMEHEKYKEFAKIKDCSKTKAECEDFWNKVAVMLNSMKGPSKHAHVWRRSWRDQVRYVIELSQQKARVKEVDNGLDVSIEYTMDNPFHDRIMSLVGWELADISNTFEDDKENLDDPLWTPNNCRKRSNTTSPTDPLQPKHRCLSPLNLDDSSRKSPVSLSPLFTSASTSPSFMAASASTTSLSGGKEITDLKNLVMDMMQAVERNTKVIEDLKNTLSLGTVQVINVDQVEDLNLVPPELPDDFNHNDLPDIDCDTNFQ